MRRGSDVREITELWRKDGPHEEMVPHKDGDGAEEEDAPAPALRVTESDIERERER